MRISNMPKQIIYVDFDKRTIYRRKSIFLRFANSIYFLEALLGVFAIIDLYFLVNILITVFQR